MENGKDFVPPILSKEPAHKSLKIGDGYAFVGTIDGFGFDDDSFKLGEIISRTFPGEDKARRFRVIELRPQAIETEYLGFAY